MTVNEVATSLGGSTANQYVELLDPFDEPFLVGYRLNVYDATGVSVGNQPLGSGMQIVDGGTPMLIGKGSVANVDQSLTINLPTTAGQACFERNDTSIIYCLRWGTITNPVGGIATSGPAPGDGQSLERCSSGGVVGSPTPKAANGCGGAGGGGTGGGSTGTGIGGGGGGTGGDTTRPLASSSFPRQTLNAVRSRGLRIRVRSNEAGRVRAQLVRRGRVLRTITRALRANVRRELVLTLPAATRRALRNAGSATFSVRLRVADAAGNARALSRSIVLRAAR
jgi:hypothetical protein